MRTNASMIEVNVSSSASAMSPQPYSRTGLFPRKARDSLCPSCRWGAALHGPRLMIRRGRFASPHPPRCPFARCVLLRTRRLSAAVCLEATGRGEIRWGGGESDAKATNHTSNSKTGFWWCYQTVIYPSLCYNICIDYCRVPWEQILKTDCGIYICFPHWLPFAVLK